MYNIVTVTIIQGTANLPCKFTGNHLPKFAMTYYIIQHLDAMNILRYYVITVGVYDHLMHTTDVRVI